MSGEELDKAVRRELSTLRAEAAELAAKHLVMAARLLEDDPEGAYAHALAARRVGPRVGVIREALGLAAYHAGKFPEALAELRAARRISGNDENWPVMADCERALGRPERALQMAAEPEVERLDRAGRVEMRIVAAGARSDLGQHDAAVVTLQSPDLHASAAAPWLARLRFAYAEALGRAGRADEARTWLVRAVDADPDGESGALDRLNELEGITFLTDLDDEPDEQPAGPDASPVATTVASSDASANSAGDGTGEASPLPAARGIPADVGDAPGSAAGKEPRHEQDSDAAAASGAVPEPPSGAAPGRKRAAGAVTVSDETMAAQDGGPGPARQDGSTDQAVGAASGPAEARSGAPAEATAERAPAIAPASHAKAAVELGFLAPANAESPPIVRPAVGASVATALGFLAPPDEERSRAGEPTTGELRADGQPADGQPGDGQPGDGPAPGDAAGAGEPGR